MTGAFDQQLLRISVLIGVLSGCAALNLVQRVSLSRRLAARSWLTFGALLLGAGVWAMQVVLLLAHQLPIVVVYHVPTMLFSLGVSMLMCFFALWVASAPRMGALQLAVAGACMGIGLAGMYYSSVFAMQIVPAVFHEPREFAIAVGIGIGASWLTLGLAAVLRHGASLVMLLARVTSGIVVGAALWWHAWRSLAAARFAPDSYSLGATLAGHEGGNGLLILIATAAALGVLALMMLTIIDHARRGVAGPRHRDANDAQLRDPLTGLGNRKLLERRFDALQESTATRDTQHALLMVDAGDVVPGIAAEVARRLTTLVRPGDTVARLDDGRFILLVASLADPSLAGRIAARVQEEIARPIEAPAGAVLLTARTGVALYPRDGGDLDSLQRIAGAAARA